MAQGRSFSVQLEAFAKAAGGRAEVFVQKLAFELLRSVVLKSPVDSGRFRAAWSVSLGTRPGFAISDSTDRTGLATVERGLRILSGYKSGLSVFITNGLPYGPVLEFGGYPNPPDGGEGKTSGGYSIQAPRGMVRISILETQRQVTKITAALNRGNTL